MLKITIFFKALKLKKLALNFLFLDESFCHEANFQKD